MLTVSMDEDRKYKPIFVTFDIDGRRVVRFIEDVKLPDGWEVDKTIRPVVE